MTPRNTSTGGVLEQMALPALKMGGYSYKTGVKIGTRLGISQHKIDVLAEDSAGGQYLISMKWQQVGGTAEQKIPFEVICLIEALKQEKYQSAYLVLGGEGWRYKDVYFSGALNEYIRGAEQVNIVPLDRFVSLANQSKL